jgi:hypothetical protein
MKHRKRMGMPRVGLVPSRAGVDAEQSSVPPEIIAILRDRARRTIVQEQQLAAKQRRLLELVSADALASSSRAAQSTEPSEDAATTPEKLFALLTRTDGRDEVRGEPTSLAECSLAGSRLILGRD